ncbi:MAG TPA: hypothetical protein H9770_08485 [Candidatus Fournierella excrementigallinarum]|nr:hypothetical protein [Candidatus Fournierella excrementigallinarum]
MVTLLDGKGGYATGGTGHLTDGQIPAIAAVAAFILTEDMSDPMVFTDRWTLLMAAIAAVQAIVAILAKKSREKAGEDEAQA